ncbi:hypothetical protein RND71_032137 [Anisodus tanguticus]|uniref:Uncharacterized protein n=1 Tax=Anisodus tanguticus TaxID=243964 RepID=A0AAE1REU6_9SOLA|nr:hypothetical protein RND71_032137 [Anisodus tanguticus]
MCVCAESWCQGAQEYLPISFSTKVTLKKMSFRMTDLHARTSSVTAIGELHFIRGVSWLFS